MTTIIVVVVVALVFFVAVCVVTFMVWKRESEMRTDSIAAIERNLEKLTGELSREPRRGKTSGFHDEHDGHKEKKEEKDLSEMEALLAETIAMRRRNSKRQDPFGWVRESGQEGQKSETETTGSIGEEKRTSFDTAVPEAENDITKDIIKDITYENISFGDGGETAEAADLKTGVSLDEVPDEAAKREDMAEPGSIILPDIDEINGSADAPEDIEPRAQTGSEPRTDATVEADDGDFYMGDDRLDLRLTSKPRMEYDVGKSGRKYTASELETLIRE